MQLKWLFVSALALVLVLAPSRVRADFILPTTSCDTDLANTSLHMSSSASLESGIKAFTYGADGDAFVTTSSNEIIFKIQLLFSTFQAPSAYVKIQGFNAACSAVFGTAFGDPVMGGTNTVSFNTFSGLTTLNNQSTTSFPNGVVRYIWIEVWDGFNNSQYATYSYLVDIGAPQNPIPVSASSPANTAYTEMQRGSSAGTVNPSTVVPKIVEFKATTSPTPPHEEGREGTTSSKNVKIKEGQAAELEWEVKDAQYVSVISKSKNKSEIIKEAQDATSQTVSPGETTTYQVVVLGPGGEVSSDEITIEVAPRDPVIIIPGIMGSTAGRLDPILHAYDGLWQGLKNAGYEENKNLFAFPYDWRLDNRETAQFLSDKINQVLQICSCDKVDLIAHSMGGLVARYYLQNLNHDTVDQLIFLGTPHLGAPKAYLAWQSGEMGTELPDNLLETLIGLEATVHGEADVVKYIHEHVQSVGQLLPVYKYLTDFNTGEGLQSENEFLTELNRDTEALKQISVENFINDSMRTFQAFTVPGKGKLPVNYPKDDGIFYGKGDGTVPANSAAWIRQDYKAISAKHVDLPDDAQGEIVKTLINKDLLVPGASKLAHKLLFIGIKSPADISLADSSGNIPANVFYSGADDPEFITLPDPAAGQYVITVTGTGDGHFELDADLLGDDLNEKQAYENMIKVGQVYKFSLVIGEDKLEELKLISGLETPPREDPLRSAEGEARGLGEVLAKTKFTMTPLASPLTRGENPNGTGGPLAYSPPVSPLSPPRAEGDRDGVGANSSSTSVVLKYPQGTQDSSVNTPQNDNGAGQVRGAIILNSSEASQNPRSENKKVTVYILAGIAIIAASYFTLRIKNK